MTKIGLFGGLMVIAVSLAGCAKPSKGTLGAANITELVERYKEAHRNKDIDALRSIYFLYVSRIWYINTPVGSMGSGEKYMPMLFDLDLVDVEVVKLPFERGYATVEYLCEREPVRENGFSPIREDGAMFTQPYMLVLLGRRPGEADGPLMEVDAGIGVSEHDGRFYVDPTSLMLDDAAEWVRTGRPTKHYYPPGHGPSNLNPQEKLRKIPKGWVSIVRPRP